MLPAGAVTDPGIYAFKLVNDATFDVQRASKEDGVNPGPQLLVTHRYGPLAADDWVSRATFVALNEAVSEQKPDTFGLTDQKTSTTTFDELGNARQATDTGGVVTGTEFDRDGRATATFEDTDGSSSGAPTTTLTTTSDADGRVLTAKDRNQGSSSGRRTASIRPSGPRTLSADAAEPSHDSLSSTLAG